MAAFRAGLFGQNFRAERFLGKKIALVGSIFLKQYQGLRPRQRQKVRASLLSADMAMSKCKQTKAKSIFGTYRVDHNLYAVAVAEPEYTWVTFIEPASSPGKIRLIKTNLERQAARWNLLSELLESSIAQP